MFDFFSDLFDEIGKNAFRYQVDSGKKIIVQGYKTILQINEENIVLKLKNGEMSISGKNLKVNEFSTNTFIATGKIFKVEIYGGDKNEK